MNLLAELVAFSHFISGKLASVDGPYRDKWGRIVYSVVIAGQVHKWRRDYDGARKLAQNYNAKVQEKARQEALALVEELAAEMKPE